MRRSRAAILCCLAVFVGSAGAQKQAPVDYFKQVQPILSQHCYGCHGPDEAHRKAELRLDVKELALKDVDGDRAIAPGKPEHSMIWERIATDDPDDIMPPPEVNNPLTQAQKDILKRWIEEGADWPEHWAFQPVERPAVPEAGDGWARSPIDRFIAQHLASAGLEPTPEAKKEALIRRVTYDLTGLPPTPEEIDAFLKDESENAYEKVVDRLLSSERYGERQAQDWLDIARYADSNGYQSDGSRQAWKWREWVIKAFNTNKPFDEFTIEQLAGDLLKNPTLEQKIATGFNRNHPTNSEAGQEVDEYRTAYVIDRVDTTATTWLGLTVACAQCHDHKFDPIPQKDFYRLYAYFNQVKEYGAEGLESEGFGSRNPRPSMRIPNPDQVPHLADLDRKIQELEDRLENDDIYSDTAQSEWENEMRAHVGDDVEWKTAEPIGMLAHHGSILRRMDDGSILATGEAPSRDVYDLTFKPGKKKITALKLEVIPDESQPEGSSGRSRKGQFILSGLKMRLSSLSDQRDPPLVFIAKADADLNQERPKVRVPDSISPGSIASSLIADDKPNTQGGGGGRFFARGRGWSIIGDERFRTHEAILVPLETLPFNNSSVLRLTLEQKSRPFKTLIGRFKISYTEDPRIRTLMLPAVGKVWSALGPFAGKDVNTAFSQEFGPEKDAKKGRLDLKKEYEVPELPKETPKKPGEKGKASGGKPGEKGKSAAAATAKAKAAEAKEAKADGKPAAKEKPSAPTAAAKKPDAEKTSAGKPQGPGKGKFAGKGGFKGKFGGGKGKFGGKGFPGKKGAVAQGGKQDEKASDGKKKTDGKKDDEKAAAAKKKSAKKPVVAKKKKPEKKVKKTSWKEHREWRDGRAFDLEVSNDTAWYITRLIESTEARVVTLRLDGPDGVKVWLNGELAYEARPQATPPTSNRSRGGFRRRGRSARESRTVRLGIRKGTNELLVKAVYRKPQTRSRRGRRGGGAAGGAAANAVAANVEAAGADFGNFTPEQIEAFFANGGFGGGGGNNQSRRNAPKRSFTFDMTPEGRDIINHEIVSALRELPAPGDAVPVSKMDKDNPKQKRIAMLRRKVKKYYRGEHDTVGKILKAELDKLKQEKRTLEGKMPETLVMEEMPKNKMRKTHVFKRGDFRHKGEEVQAGVPSVLPPMSKDLPSNRLGLAKWLVSPENPLTSRVTVNRIWQQYFGKGFVQTPEDFGIRSKPPTHPELLDWLSNEFMTSGWDMKKLHKSIVMSATYRQGGKPSAEALEKDPENKLLSRAPRKRLSAEMVRDGALAISELLVNKVGGESVRPPQPKGLWNDTAGGRRYNATKGKDQYRRGLYVYWRRGNPYPSMMIFDATKRETCTAQRARTTTALQALVLLNDPVYVEAAKMLGKRLAKEAEEDDMDGLKLGFRLCTSREAQKNELAILGSLLEKQREHYKADVEAAKKLLKVGEAKVGEDVDHAELAAWTAVASTLLNLDATIHN